MTPCSYSFPRLEPAADIALIGPSNLSDMREHPRVYRERGVRYIYDPAQQLPVLTREDLLAAVEGCFLLVGNDYEIQLIMNMTGLDKKTLLGMTRGGIVVTLGEKGSLVTEKNGTETAIPALPVSSVQDPTGAGDAYRSGLIKGLARGASLVESARLGAVCSAFCIEKTGTQGHTFTREEFLRRYAATFGEGPAIAL